MARVKRNSVLKALQGSIGKELVFKQYADKVVITRYPDMSKVKPSARQKEQREKMKEANAYARTVLSNPELKAIYEQNLQKGESIYRKAINDYFARLKLGQ
jgi:hypothetical protein